MTQPKRAGQSPGMVAAECSLPLFFLLLFWGTIAGRAQSAAKPEPETRILATAFGAVCDGSHDDTAAIQAALNATSSYNHYTAAKEPADVELPDGTCVISRTLTMGPFGSLVGQGNSSTLLANYASWTGRTHDALDVTFAGPIEQTIPIEKKLADLKIVGENNRSISDSTALHIFNSTSRGNYGGQRYMLAGFAIDNVLIDGFDTGIRAEDWGYASVNGLSITDTRVSIWLEGSVVQVGLGHVNITDVSGYTAHTTRKGSIGLWLTNDPKFTGCARPGPNATNLCGPQGVDLHDSEILAANYNLEVEAGTAIYFHDNGFSYGETGSVYFRGADSSDLTGLIYEVWFHDNEVGTAGNPNQINVLIDSYIYQGFNFTNNFLDVPNGPVSSAIAIEFHVPGVLGVPGGFHINGNHFQMEGTGILFDSPIQQSSVTNNTGNGQQTAFINLVAGNYAYTYFNGNISSGGADVLIPGTATNYVLGFNRSGFQATGQFTATGSGCSITSGAPGNQCSVTMTMDHRLSLPDTNYTVNGCSVSGAIGAVTVSQAEKTISDSQFTVSETALSPTATGGGIVHCTVNAN